MLLCRNLVLQIGHCMKSNHPWNYRVIRYLWSSVIFPIIVRSEREKERERKGEGVRNNTQWREREWEIIHNEERGTEGWRLRERVRRDRERVKKDRERVRRDRETETESETETRRKQEREGGIMLWLTSTKHKFFRTCRYFQCPSSWANTARTSSILHPFRSCMHGMARKQKREVTNYPGSTTLLSKQQPDNVQNNKQAFFVDNDLCVRCKPTVTATQLLTMHMVSTQHN